MTLTAMFSIFLLGSDFIISNANGGQTEGSVHFQNNQYYVFWSDTRALPLYYLYGARVSTTGTVIDPNGKSIFGDSVGYAQAAYDGANFLVVWREGCWGSYSIDIRGVRVTPDCNANGSPFFISQAANVQSMPDVAFGGGNHMVVWMDGRINNKNIIYASRVTPAGTVLDPSGIQVGPSDTLMQSGPAIVYAGTRFYVVWSYDAAPYSIMGRFIETTGALSDTARIYTAGEIVSNVRIASSGSNYMVSWMEGTGGSGYQLKGLIVSSAGVPVGSAFVVAPLISKYANSMCFDGTNYFLCYGESPSTAIWGIRYNVSGNPIGSAFRVSNTGTGQNNCDVVAGANNRYFNIWSQFLTNNYDIYGNIDVLITDVQEENAQTCSRIRLKSRIVRDAITLENADGVEAAIFDALGARIGTTRGGYFDCRLLAKGVYVIRSSRGEIYKVIKI